MGLSTLLELDLRRVSRGLIHLVPPCTQSVISLRYLIMAENVQSGRVVWERDPSQRKLNEKIFFSPNCQRVRGQTIRSRPREHVRADMKCSDRLASLIRIGHLPMMFQRLRSNYGADWGSINSIRSKCRVARGLQVCQRKMYLSLKVIIMCRTPIIIYSSC